MERIWFKDHAGGRVGTEKRDKGWGKVVGKGKRTPFQRRGGQKLFCGEANSVPHAARILRPEFLTPDHPFRQAGNRSGTKHFRRKSPISATLNDACMGQGDRIRRPVPGKLPGILPCPGHAVCVFPPSVSNFLNHSHSASHRLLTLCFCSCRRRHHHGSCALRRQSHPELVGYRTDYSQ